MLHRVRFIKQEMDKDVIDLDKNVITFDGPLQLWASGEELYIWGKLLAQEEKQYLSLDEEKK